ncbi:MAG: outer membrane protein assembly factor BamB, partial [Candidatus Azotimanducaceae bacterium]
MRHRALLIFCLLVGHSTWASASPTLFLSHSNLVPGAVANGEIGSVDLDTGVYSTLFGGLGELTGLAASEEKLYTFDNDSAQLHTIDPWSGMVEASVQVDGFVGLIDLAMDPVTDTLFGVDNSGALLIVDPETGAISHVGTLGAGGSYEEFGSIGFAADGTFFLGYRDFFQPEGSHYYSVDKTNGAIIDLFSVPTIGSGMPEPYGAFGLAVSP